MALDDLPLGQPRPASAATPQPTAASPTRWVVVGSAAIIVAALLTFWWLNRAQPIPAPLAPTTATDVAMEGNRPKRQNLNPPLLLDESDDAIRQMILALSRDPLIAKLLTTSGLARGTALTIVQIGEGRTPATPLKILRPATHVQMLGTQNGRLDPATYVRWDSAAAALTSVSPKTAAQVYVNIQSLLDQAYHELGHPDSFDDAFARAIRMLADTPDLVEDPQLLRRENYFEHDDAALRGLKPVQKQFLLMGPANRHKILEWLRALATNLDLKLS